MSLWCLDKVLGSLVLTSPLTECPDIDAAWWCPCCVGGERPLHTWQRVMTKAEREAALAHPLTPDELVPLPKIIVQSRACTHIHTYTHMRMRHLRTLAILTQGSHHKCTHKRTPLTHPVQYLSTRR